MPLDFGSQRAARIDLTGQAFAAQQPNNPYSDQELSVVGMKLAEALTGVRQVSPLVADFTTDFTKVLVLQKDHTAPDHCSSGSHGQFIGRSFVTNLQSTDVTPSAIADAVIHESIHALLYMQQCMQPWGPDELIYDQTPRVNSPWTGRPLPLRSFIEASFVWFALAHFWAYALSKPTFDLQQSRALLSRAVVGFLHTPLPDLLGDARGHLLPALVESVATMQERIQAAWGSP
jgi:HEXXH motif-containing protein